MSMWSRCEVVDGVVEAGADERNFADEVIADRMTKEFADVAQLVEQLIRNQQVNGSSPFVGSNVHAGCSASALPALSCNGCSDGGSDFDHV